MTAWRRKKRIRFDLMLTSARNNADTKQGNLMDHTHHSHSHHHGHSHGSSHAPNNFGRAFAVGIILNFAFVLIEAGYGYYANSLSLMADAGHNLGDVLGLALAWFAIWLGTKKPSQKYTYGLGQTSILAALLNALLLLVAVAGIVWESIARLRHPQLISGSIVIYVATIGIFINAGTALMFRSGKKSDLNIRGAYLHMAADALVSLAVVISGFIMSSTGWLWLDPVVSLIISAVIVFGTWELLRDSFNLAISAVPSTIKTEKVKQYLLSLNGVKAVHDFHIWAMSTTENALTAHIVIPTGHPGDHFLREISSELEHHFQIHHSTIQIEIANDSISCALESDEVV